MFSIPSLSDLSKIISAETQEEKEEIVISYDQIIKAWSSFTDVKKAQGNTDYYLALSGARLEFNNPILTVRFAIESTKELFEKFSDDFLAQMRKKMNSNELIFEVKMEEKNNENLKLYTDKDKFQYIAEKNPKILELQKRFGLDFEY